MRGSDLPPLFPTMDKWAHLLEYSLLGLLLGRAFRLTWEGRQRWRAALFTVLVGAAVAALDEIYQARIPGRSSDILDWVTDVGALTFAVLLTQVVPSRPLFARPGRGGGGNSARGTG